jgi:hypothetical protein
MREFLSLGELAKALGRDKSGLSRHAKRGTIPRRSDGKFELEKVKAALARNVDGAMARNVNRRRPSVDTSASTPRQRSTRVDRREPVDGLDVNRILVDGKFMTIENARALAETYRAALAKLQYEQAATANRLGASA